MIIKPLIWSVVIVSLSKDNIVESNIISKPDYTTPYNGCQEELYKSTMNYNYITTEKLIESNIKKYQDLLPP
jgi:hypothetical protein